MNSIVSATAGPAGIALPARGRRRAGGRARRPVGELLVAAERGRRRAGGRARRPVRELLVAAERGRRRAGGRARRPVRELLVAVAVILTVIGAAGVALAYWQAGGTGAGAATTGTVTEVALSPGTPAVTLYPGGQSDVTLTVSNPNITAVTIAALTLDTTQASGGFAVDAGHSGCAVSVLSLSRQTNAGAGWTVPAKAGAVNGALAITLPNALAMDAGAANACQGAQLTVYLVAGP